MQGLPGCLRRCAAAGLLAAASTAQANETPFERLFVFGDSLSDGGYYATLLPIPPGTSFTTNPDPVAPEVLAAELGLPLEVDYGLGGTNFATGGARVTQANNASVPIASQIDIALAGGRRFGDNDLVYIQGGGNDFFAFVAGGADDPTILTDAAQDLAGQVSRLQAAGAQRIVTMSVQTGGNAGLLLFNQVYEEALAAKAVNALYFDTDALFEEMVASAEDFGFTAILEPACTTGSLACTRDDLVAPDANETHLLADDVHPAGKTQRIQGQAIASLLRAPEQIGQLAYAGQVLFRSHRDLNEMTLLRGFDQEVDSNAWFARVGYHDFSHEGSVQVTGVEEDGLLFNAGLDHRLAEETSVGLSFTISDGEGEFDEARGDYEVDAVSAIFYVQGNAGPVNLHADAMAGRASYDDLSRELRLGPTLREHQGDTDADFFGLSVGASRAFSAGDGFAIIPVVGLEYQSLEIDGYTESSGLSTAANFGEQELDSLTGSLGATFTANVGDSLHFYISGEYRYEFNDDERELSITPRGAPVAYRSELYQADRNYFNYAAGLYYRLSDSLVLQTAVRGIAERGDLEQASVFLGVSLEM
jgi:outer membrane lipase/esterase